MIRGRLSTLFGPRSRSSSIPASCAATSGTLIGRAGNAYDKALLLRRLLDDAGYETRLVRTTLTDAQARSLVAQMAAPALPLRPSPIPLLADIRGRLQEMVGALPAGTVDPSTLDKYAVANQLISVTRH